MFFTVSQFHSNTVYVGCQRVTRPFESLEARGARAGLFLVGGAALAVAYDATRATRDLDAVFIPTDVVRQAAAAVAERERLAQDTPNTLIRRCCAAATPKAPRS